VPRWVPKNAKSADSISALCKLPSSHTRKYVVPYFVPHVYENSNRIIPEIHDFWRVLNGIEEAEEELAA
jgi:hypothetical protein